MPGSYKQLDFAERQQVYFLRKQGLSCRGIARQLGRSCIFRANVNTDSERM